jgi:hypothetical protein
MYCMPANIDLIFGPGNLGGWADNCCVDGLNGCVGVCVSSTSTVTAMTAANPKAHTLPISELAIGDKVLAQTHEGKHVFDEVEGLPHGKSADSEHFVELVISTSKLSPAHVVRATPHHTFPACSHAATFVMKTTKAKDFKAGDCVMTPAGKGKVTSVAMTPAAKDEEAYTIVLKGKHDLVAVNGVFTHAAHDSMMGRPPAKQRSALRGPRAAAPPALSGFQQHVVDAVQYRLQAAAAKA